MAKAKWFYALQPKVETYLQEICTRHHLGVQDVKAYHVYEIYTVVRKGHEKAEELIIMYSKARGRGPHCFYTYIRIN